MSHKSRFFVYIDQHVGAEIFPSFPYFPALPSKRSTSASGRAAARSLGRTRAVYQTVSRSHQSTVTTVRPFKDVHRRSVPPTHDARPTLAAVFRPFSYL